MLSMRRHADRRRFQSSCYLLVEAYTPYLTYLLSLSYLGLTDVTYASVLLCLAFVVC